MFSTLRRNKTWLWGIIIIVVIISFVIFFSPDVDLRRSEGGTATVGSIDGQPIKMDEFQKAANEASVFYFLNRGQWPQEGRGWDNETQAKQRLFLKRKAKEEGIEVTPAAATVWLQGLPIFQNKEGKYSPALYERYMTNVFNPAGINQYMLEELAKSEMAIKQLVASHGLPGVMVSPRYVTTTLKKDKEILVTEVASFPLSNYVSQVQVVETNLLKFYTNRMSTYRVPEKVQVHYVEFAATNYFDKGMELFAQKEKAGLAEFVDKAYKANDPELYTDEDGKALSEEAAKAKMTEEIQKSYSLRAARSAAAEFVNTYFAQEKFTEKDFLDAAKAKGLTTQLSEPFSLTGGKPEAMDVPMSFVQAAWKLDATNAVIPPVMGQTNVYAICFAKRIESTNPAYAEIADKVLEDYKKSEAVKQCNTEARNFANSVTNTLASGKSFQEACDQAKALYTVLPEFTADTEELESELPASWWQIKNAVSFKEGGTVCTPIIPASTVMTNSAACVVYLKERKAADQATVDAAVKDFTQQLLAGNAENVFGEWFATEYEKSAVETVWDVERREKAAQEKAARDAEAKALEAQKAATNKWTATTNAAPAGATPAAAPAKPATPAPAAAPAPAPAAAPAQK